MLRWLLITFLALLLIGWLAPFLRRFGFGRLPGDFNFRIGKRDIQVPLSSAIVMSMVVAGISQLI